MTVMFRLLSLHRLPNACELYRIPRECSRDLNLLVYGLIYWIATPLTWLAMTKEIQRQPPVVIASVIGPHANMCLRG